VAVLPGNGDRTFQSALAYGLGGRNALSVVVADANREGEPDLFVANGCAIGGNRANGRLVGVLIDTSLTAKTTALATSQNPSNFRKP
jgi:hypothetical protein